MILGPMARGDLHMADLRRRTGIPATTVHHYVRLGLLPPPRRPARNRFIYGEQHVQRLRLIRLLRRRRGLPLEAIRRVLPELAELQRDQAFRPEMWDRVVGRAQAAEISPRLRLLGTAKDAFSRSGYADVNVDDLCRAAGLSKGSFYRHYRSKEDIFLAAASSAGDEALEVFVRAAGASPVPAESAAPMLAAALQPRLPLFLELVARAMHGRAGYRSAARRVLGGLAAEVGRRIRDADPPERAGASALERAIGMAAFSVLPREAAPGASDIPI